MGALNKSIWWKKSLLVPSDFYYTIIIACIVAFVPVAFQETISTISSVTQPNAWRKILLFLLFTSTVIYMGKKFLDYAIFAKFVSEDLKLQGKKTDSLKYLGDYLLPGMKNENIKAFNDVVAAIIFFVLASIELIIMVALK